MDLVIFLNVLIFLVIFFYIFKRYTKYRTIQLIDFLLIFYCLFFPIGLIRPYMGFESLIGYDIFYNYSLLEDTSLIVFFFLFFFLIGCNLGNQFSKLFLKNNIIDNKIYSLKYLLSFRNFSVLSSILTFLALVIFIRQQGSLSEYFENIESIRQTLSGQMGNFTLIYFNVLLSLYTIIINKKFVITAKIGILVSIIFFVIYGYRGPIISIIIITFFILQKLNIFKITLNVKNVIITSAIMFLFVYSQDVRNLDSGDEPFFLKLITRFSGYEPIMVIYDKVVLQGMFTIDTFYTNVISFIELPVPRTLLDDKVKPISILLTEKLFYDIGKRSFETGGISPTIVGSLIWNFHYLGCFVIVLFGFVSSYIENCFKKENDSFRVLKYVSFSLYLILAIEYPENFLGVLWMLIIGLAIISIFIKILNNNKIY